MIVLLHSAYSEFFSVEEILIFFKSQWKAQAMAQRKTVTSSKRTEQTMLI